MKEINTALRLRAALESDSLGDQDIRAVEHKARLHQQAEEVLANLKTSGDLIVAPLFVKGKTEVGMEIKDARAFFGVYASTKQADKVEGMREQARRLLGNNRPFHWPLEFPEVFLDEKRGGFDAIISNPPFQGGQKITGALGVEYRNYLVNHLAGGQRGSADLCAYFYLRAHQLLRQGGLFGMLATNTIAQGDTREVGLEQITSEGSTIMRAIPSMKWPGVANLEVAVVWVTKGMWKGERLVGEVASDHITEYLSTKGATTGKPFRLKANEDKSFQGSIVLGMGFILTPEEAQALINKDKRNKEVLFPYINGEDLNSRPDQSPSRWVINFFDWPLEKAETFKEPMRIVRDKVKPERDKNNRKVYRDYWWHYAEKRPALYPTISGMERVLIIAATSRTLAFAFSQTNLVFAHAVYVLALDSSPVLAILQSSLHDVWARCFASSMRDDLRYTPSDCFETFSFPIKWDRLEKIGGRYYEYRQSLMQARQEGLTKTYNRMHDQKETAEDIARLRKLHVEMDQAVAAAYGWMDLDLGHGFHETKQGIRYTISEAARSEVLDRLLALNHERYEEEVKQGLHEKDKKKAGKAAAKKRDAKGKGQTDLFPEPVQEEMFDDDGDTDS